MVYTPSLAASLGAALMLLRCCTAQEAAPVGGLQVRACLGAARDNAYNGVNDLRYLAQAALNAMDRSSTAPSPSVDPFRLFFPEATDPQREAIKSMMQAAIDSANGSGDLLDVTCNMGSQCGDNPVAYVERTTPPRIVLCYKYHELHRDNFPCNDGPGAPSTATFGRVMLHEFLMARFDPKRGGPLENARDVGNLSLLGSLAWAIGLGSNPWMGEACHDKFQPLLSVLSQTDESPVADGLGVASRMGEDPAAALLMSVS
ncbi:MAG: hypothetical protein M1833_002098 [Piccolia ochrophora]|nr:MAG: hypothetical protein M1833_002098 [Piccolia ochrophora]